MATDTITDKLNNVVALLIDQCKCEAPSEIKAAFQELQAALNAQLAAVTTIIATLPEWKNQIASHTQVNHRSTANASRLSAWTSKFHGVPGMAMRRGVTAADVPATVRHYPARASSSVGPQNLSTLLRDSSLNAKILE
jgi:hypothetical protein